jgi:hypothetical protein
VTGTFSKNLVVAGSRRILGPGRQDIFLQEWWLVEAGGKSTCVLGRSHFATVSQLKGIPILTLPAPEDGYGISCQTKYRAKYHLLT